MTKSLTLPRSLNLAKKRTQRILPAVETLDFGALSPDEALMLKEELEIATAGANPRHLWFMAQEDSGAPLPREAAAALVDGDAAMRRQLQAARQGRLPAVLPRDTAFGLLPVANATLGYTRGI